MTITTAKDYINSDLNVRLPHVSPQDSAVIVDKEAILQSIYRLFETEEGEIPFYRKYGLNLKQFIQQPLNESLTRDVDDYVRGKLELFEPRVEVVKSYGVTDYNHSAIMLQYWVRLKTTGEIVNLAPLRVPVG